MRRALFTAAPRRAALAAAAAYQCRLAVDVFNGSAEELEARIAQRPTVVDFFTDWCGPCRQIAPTFEALSKEERFSHIQFLKTNVEINDDVGMAHEIRSIPTFALFVEGQKVGTVEGASAAEVERLLTKAPEAPAASEKKE